HPSDVEENLKRISEVISYFLEQNKKIISIGGEHTITLGIIRAFKETPCIISFDAHLDLRDEYLGYKYDHACVMRRIYEEKKSKIIEIGTRAVSRDEIEFANKNGILYFTPFQIRVLGIREIARRILLSLQDCKSIYISYDMDVFDPSFAPGVATPEPEGLDPTTVLDLVNILLENTKSKITGFDIVELAPPFDPSYITIILASKLILETSAIIAKYTKII
ncbi:MAG: agmatinase, partial [Sulfolobaceae archaeon]